MTAALAKGNQYDITVIAPLEYHEIPFNMTYIAATNDLDLYNSKVFYPRIKEEGVKYITGTCQKLTDTAVSVSDGTVLTYDVAIVVTGINYPHFSPNPTVDVTKEQRLATIQKKKAEIDAAKTIVISGGGPIGVEVAGDIIIRNKDKKVILIHSHDVVLEKMSRPLAQKATDRLKAIGCELILNERVSSSTEKTVTLKSGKIIDCDLYISSIREKPYSSFMPSDSIDARGYIKVNNFKVASESVPKVFAFGDVTNYDEVKGAARVNDQFLYVANSVKQFLDSKPTSPYVAGFKGKVEGPMLVSIGINHPDQYGVGPYLPNACLNFCCFICCCAGAPCHTPAGKGVSKMKSDWNSSNTAQAGFGVSDHPLQVPKSNKITDR